MPWGTLFGSWISGSGICANISSHSGFARPPCCTLARAAPLPGRLNWIAGFSFVAGGFPPWSRLALGRTLFSGTAWDGAARQRAVASKLTPARRSRANETPPSVCLSVTNRFNGRTFLTSRPSLLLGWLLCRRRKPSGLLRWQGSHVASRTAAATRGERKCAVAAMRWAFFSGVGRFSPTFRRAGQVDLSTATGGPLLRGAARLAAVPPSWWPGYVGRATAMRGRQM